MSTARRGKTPAKIANRQPISPSRRASAGRPHIRPEGACSSRPRQPPTEVLGSDFGPSRWPGHHPEGVNCGHLACRYPRHPRPRACACLGHAGAGDASRPQSPTLLPVVGLERLIDVVAIARTTSGVAEITRASPLRAPSRPGRRQPPWAGVRQAYRGSATRRCRWRHREAAFGAGWR
jgi:hypothetical protein